MRARRGARAVAALLLLASVTSCEFKGLSDVRLPGGAATGDDVYRITVVFDDVLDLVQQSAVKVNDVTVGSVEKISLDGFQAVVVCRLEDHIVLPTNTVAELRQTSLLGEKFISLEVPEAGPSAGRLADGALIPVSRTDRNPEVEELLGALSGLLNGGGVEQLHTISVELSAALAGREDEVRDFLHQLDTFIAGLDASKADVVRAIDALDALTATLARQKQTIATALDEIGPGLTVLADQRANLTQMLQGLARLGDVGTRVIRASRADTEADLKALQPILEKLEAAGDYLPGALPIILTYPYPPTVEKGIRGDYAGLKITADLDFTRALGNVTSSPSTTPTTAPGAGPMPATPSTPYAGPVGDILDLLMAGLR
ncbi:MAG TPA: MCE family protein [Mycobacteriales bacterium]|nr:MCE family protein [Mycobacteriales bacterium]